MTMKPGVALRTGQVLVALDCFDHPSLGDVHIGNQLVVQTAMVISGSDDKIKVLNRRTGKIGDVEVKLLRRYGSA